MSIKLGNIDINTLGNSFNKAYLGSDIVFEGVAFISLWETTTANETITLPYTLLGTYTGVIDWGDGTVTPNTYANRSHEYATADQYTIKIRGTVDGWIFLGFEASNLLNIENLDGLDSVGSFAFYLCDNLTAVNTEETVFFDNFSQSFEGCLSLDFSLLSGKINTSNCSSFLRGFRNSSLDIDLGIDLSNATTISRLYELTAYNDVVNINAPNLSDCSYFVASNSTFNQTVTITSNNLTSALASFILCTSLDSPIVINSTSLTNVSSFLDLCSNFNSSVTINSLVLSNCFRMYQSCTIYNQPITYSTDNVENMDRMFASALAFNQPLDHLNYGKVKTLNNFMLGKSFLNYDATYYDDLLIKWDDLPSNGGLDFSIFTNVNITMGTIKHTIAGATARASLISKGFIITDGGQV